MGSMVLQVFDTLEHGQSYREYCTQVARLLLCCEQTTAPVLRELPHRVHTADVAHVNGATDVQVLKQPLADLVTLDLKRISGKGIISGASFRVPSLADATIRFGSTPVEQASQVWTDSSQQQLLICPIVSILSAIQQGLTSPRTMLEQVYLALRCINSPEEQQGRDKLCPLRSDDRIGSHCRPQRQPRCGTRRLHWSSSLKRCARETMQPTGWSKPERCTFAKDLA